MGLSLLNLGKKVFDQLNPADNGRTFQNPQGNAPAQQAAGQAPPSVFHQLTHNGATNLVGNLTYKPFIQAPMQFANDFADSRNGVVGADQKLYPDFAATFPGFVANNLFRGGQAGYNLAFKAPIQDLLGKHASADQARAIGIQEFNQTTPGQATHPIQYGIASAAHATPQAQVDAGLDPTATGAQKFFSDPLMGTLGTYGLLEGGFKSADRVMGRPVVTPKAAAAAPVDVPKAAAPAAEATPQPVAAEPTPKAAAQKKVSTGIPAIDQAIANMHEHYNSSIESAGDINSVVKATKGTAAAGQLLAGRLGRAITKNLTKPEAEAVYNFLQGVKDENLTPRARKVGAALRPLYNTALKIRQEVKPDTNTVREYAPRILRSTVKNAVRTAKGAAGKIKSVLNLSDLESGFSKSRQYGKFVDQNGQVSYGKPSDLGLVRHKDGSLSNGKQGKNRLTYKQLSTNTHELQQNLGLDYLKNAGHVSSLYHTDTARLQAKYAALKELATNPANHGLLTKDQVEAGGFDGMKEVNVPGLKDANGENFYAKARDARQLERDGLFGHADARSIPGKIYDAFSNVATQFIVLNPLFHGANQLVQSAIAAGNISGYGGGWARLAKGVFTMTDEDAYHYLKNGGHVPSYGSELKNALSRATGGTTKLPSKAMAAIELRLRVGLYKASVEGGMKPADAISNIDKFLGDQKQLSRATQRVTLFAHYFKTVGGAVVDQVVHPVANKGATINTALTAGIILGLTQQYQQATGNDAAYVRMPGELGLIKEGVKAVGEIRKGEVPSIVTNRINPVAKEIGQQVSNHDLFTGKPVTDSPGGRLGHAVNAELAPSTQVSQVTSGRRSGAEVAENQLGLYSPHAKGYQAAPKVGFLNTPKALPGTGEHAQTAYFDALHTAQQAVHGDKKLVDGFSSFVDRSHDPKTGQTIQNSPAESIENSRTLFANDKLRGIVQQFETAQPSHDPMWDLPDDKLKTLMQYRAQYTGDAQKAVLHQQATDASGNNWIDDVSKLSGAFYANLPKIPGAKPPKASDQTPPYPSFGADTQQLLDAYNGASADDKVALMKNYGGELSDAFNQIAQWTNKMRKAEGALAKTDYPVADAATQAIINHYNSLPEHDGKKGGNATRFAWSQANPALYAKMQAYLTQATMHSLIDEASKSQFEGTVASQKLLKDIKNAGQYDIATGTDANGNKTYEVNPQLAYEQSQAGTGYGKRVRFINTEDYRVTAPKGKFAPAKVAMKSSAAPRHYAVTKVKPVKRKKVALRKSKV